MTHLPPTQGTVLLDGDPQAPQQARLGAALAARGWNVLVLDAPHVADQICREFGQPCKELHSLPRRLFALHAWHLQRMARSHHVDVVHLNFVTPRQRVWVGEAKGPAYVATAWGSDLNREIFRRSAAHDAAVDAILAGASAVTADSWPLLRKAEARMGNNPAPRQWILWGADLQQFSRAAATDNAQAIRLQLGIPAGAKVLLSPRQPQRHYHVERIVEGFAASRWATEGVLVLKLHGKSGEDAYLYELMALAKRLGVADRVLLAPRVPYDQLPGLFALADAAVSLPEADGVPSTFLELMAMQVPIVATDLPDYEGVLPHGERGLLVPAKDKHALVRALDQLLEQPQETAAMVERARQWALANADWSQSVAQWEALYRQAIAGKRRSN